MTSSRVLKSVLRTSTAVLGLAAAAVSPSYAIVGNDAYLPASLVDTTNITGVGQMVIDQKNDYIGLCTVSLINPRTVIFASHCVNEGDTDFRPASDYGAANGGYPIAFFFNANNNVQGNSAIGHWLRGSNGGAKYLTRTDEYAYNSNYVIYNTLSTQLGMGNNFLQADIAMASLDTPATNIPTWTLLFSPITEPTHATIVGYGNNGIGSVGGAGGIDYRRRVAENTISVLSSLDDQDSFLFPKYSGGLPQNLYMADFNDPKFGTAQANEYDFNIFHDAALPKEGITAPGDSGGPLIIDQLFSKQVIAAVLSGGDRFYTGQPSSSYGTTSFYQPLYLFWDWIVSNNPYKYVSAKTGDGSWTDPTHWVMNLDPNYVTIDANGNLVNALPTEPAQGVPEVDQVNSPKFGQVCYFNDCYDIGKDQAVHYSNAANGEVSGLPGLVKFTPDETDTSASDPMMSLVQHWLESQASNQPSAIMHGAPVDGAPGSSNFVPDNIDPVENAVPRYYDVTLSADGTTTLSGAQVVIDRLTINGAKTGLNIASSGGLGVNIDVTMYAGILNVDGVLVTNGDLALMGGLLTGSGTVWAPYTTAVLGGIAPGGVGKIGTLRINGNVILSSGSGFLVDVGANASDRLDVRDGTLSLGGTLVVMPTAGYTPKWHETKIIASGDAITGKFDNIPDTIAGVLYPVAGKVAAATYDTEVVTFEAAKFQAVLSNPTADQVAIGGVLDTDRAGSYDKLASIYSAVDSLADGSLSGALDALVPNAARSVPQTALLLSGAHANFLWQYMGATDPSSEPRVAVQTGTLKLAQNSQSGSFEMRNLLTSLGSAGDCSSGRIACATDATSGGSSDTGGMALPKGVGAFLSGQKIDGNIKLGGDGGKADVDGFLIALGADVPVSSRTRVGVSFGIGEADTNLRDQPAHTKLSSRQFFAYSMYMHPEGYFANGFVGIGWQSFHTVRQVTLGTTPSVLEGRAGGYSPSFGLQVGMAFADVIGGTIKPAVGIQYGQTRFDGYTETGGPAALTVGKLGRPSANTRVGFDSDWTFDVSGIAVKPQVHAFLVNRLESHVSHITAGFAAAPDATASFEVAGDSPVWADLGLKLDAEVYDNTTLGFTFNANPGNAGGTYTAVGGSLHVKL